VVTPTGKPQANEIKGETGYPTRKGRKSAPSDRLGLANHRRPLDRIIIPGAGGALCWPEVEDWLAVSCDTSRPNARTASSVLYAAFTAWCAAGGVEIVSMTAFGRSLQALGFPTMKDAAGRRIRLGVRLHKILSTAGPEGLPQPSVALKQTCNWCGRDPSAAADRARAADGCRVAPDSFGQTRRELRQ